MLFQKDNYLTVLYLQNKPVLYQWERWLYFFAKIGLKVDPVFIILGMVKSNAGFV